MKALLLLSLLTSFAHANTLSILEAWKGFSDPDIMSSGFTHKFSELPLAGTVEIGPKAWSGHYWPSQHGGINNRWNAPGQPGFNYKSPTFTEVRRMSLEQLAQLAPSEKYDLLLGKYDYPLKKEAEGVASRRAPDWAGICHGWAPAALHHNEPTPKVLTNPDGIKIPFASSDIKALLSYYYAFHHEVESTHQIGLRCFFGNWMGGARGCDEDLNAGAFHIVITNMLGLRQEGFMADIDRFKEVWNQPIVGFKSKVLNSWLAPSSNAAKTAVKEMKIATELFYVNESDNVTWDVVHGTKEQIISKKNLVYRIELNREGKIVGGSWESDERPDFLWNKARATDFKGILFKLSGLIND
jgi:hypothetical protein